MNMCYYLFHGGMGGAEPDPDFLFLFLCVQIFKTVTPYYHLSYYSEMHKDLIWFVQSGK